MASISGAELDRRLRAGGVVVASSDRSARAVKAGFHRARRAEGLRAWPAPRVLDWKSFVRAEWMGRAGDERLVLNPVQERSLWSHVTGESEPTSDWLAGPRDRIADLAMEAHDLLCAYAPHLLRAPARKMWQQDAGAFSAWLSQFEERSSAEGLLSPSRLPLELLEILKRDGNERPGLVLAGFDRLLPVQQRVLDAWGAWDSMASGETAADIRWYAAGNEQQELTACALWCREQLAACPDARLLVLAQDAAKRRGEMERAFLKHLGGGQPPRFEFSLGVPLSQVGVVRAASLLLHWLGGALKENDLDWLLASGASAAQPQETAALQGYMRALRQRGLQRNRWTVEAFLRQAMGSTPAQIAWTQRITEAHRRWRASAGKQSSLDWAALVPQLLETIGWPGWRPLTSAEFQGASRWQQVLDVCGSLAFDDRRVTWNEFLSDLDRTLSETLFAEESQDAPVLIAGPAESAGLSADGIWFLGADEEAWPASGTTHPLLPIEVQREAGMPHATAQLDWKLADAITRRVLGSSAQVCFSYGRQKDDVETRASRLVGRFAGSPQPLPHALAAGPARSPVTVVYEDNSRIALPSAGVKTRSAQLSLFEDAGAHRQATPTWEAPGGSAVLTHQSQCAFKAFATARLGAQGWEAAQAGLTAAQRGQLLHAVLHAVWGENSGGIRTFTQLETLGADLRAWVEDHVRRVLAEEMPIGAREQMPARYLELEERRLTGLVTEWLEYERTRVPFDVEATEVKATTNIAGLTLNLRLDRFDRLNDNSLLVIDYKSGNVSPKSWDLPRPDDVQLPLYANFGLPAERQVGGLVFAKLRPGSMCFDGRVADASATLNSNIKGNGVRVKNPLTPDLLSQWRETIEQLARDFLAGRADVDPRDYPKTCERCGLYTLCRVREREDELEADEDDEGAEVGDE